MSLVPALWSIHVAQLTGRVDGTMFPSGRGRLAVVAPHPDDEILGAAPFLAVYGPRATVIVATDGDGFKPAVAVALGTARTKPGDFERFGRLRRSEQSRGLLLLAGRGGAAHLVRLGFSDRGLWPMLTRPGVHRSPYTGDTRTEGSDVDNGTRQQAGGLFASLERTLVSVRPDVVLAPHPSDTHPDHRVLGALTDLALADLEATGRLANRPVLLRYLVHKGPWPLPKGFHPGAALAPPRELLAPGTCWYAVPLSPALRERMRAAVGAHRTQTTLLRPVLLAFVKKNALVARMAPLRLSPGGRLGWETPASPGPGPISAAAPLLRRITATRSPDGNRVFLAVSGVGRLPARTLLLRTWQPTQGDLRAATFRTRGTSIGFRTGRPGPVLVMLELRSAGHLVARSALRVLTLT